MSRTWWRWARLLGGAAIMVALVRQVGTGPFLDAVSLIDGWSLAAAVALTLLTTVCCAWRWSLVARGLGVAVSVRSAVPAYYRSQFINTTLPGGVLGDVHRGVQHGRDVGDVSRSMRAVGWERSAGQVVQLVLALVVLALLPSPVHASWPVVAVLFAVAVVVVVAVAVVVAAGRPGRRRADRESRAWVRIAGAAVADVRRGLLARRAWPGVLFASAVVVAGHVGTFLLAARVAGSTVSPLRMLPLALLAMLAMAVPMNIAGWGPREGVAAWSFNAAGLSAAQGVSTAVVYGVLVLVASLPGAAVLIVSWWRRPARSFAPSAAGLEDSGRG